MTMTRLAAPLLALALVAAGCSSDGNEGIASLEASDTTDAPATTSDLRLESENALLEFTQCLRDQGLDVDDPELDADGEFRFTMPIGEFMERMNSTESRAALDACQQYLAGVTQQFGGFDRTDIEDRLLAYAECMRQNGYDMGDPDLSGGFQLNPEPGEAPGAFGNIDTDDPAFQAANDVCQSVFVGAFDTADQ